jgi:hypothetical protein
LNPQKRWLVFTREMTAGVKDAAVVKCYGIRLLPELYEHLNLIPFEAAARMEVDLADDGRRAGYTVMGGH